jgi:hypothetical protein
MMTMMTTNHPSRPQILVFDDRPAPFQHDRTSSLLPRQVVDADRRAVYPEETPLQQQQVRVGPPTRRAGSSGNDPIEKAITELSSADHPTTRAKLCSRIRRLCTMRPPPRYRPADDRSVRRSIQLSEEHGEQTSYGRPRRSSGAPSSFEADGRGVL